MMQLLLQPMAADWYEIVFTTDLCLELSSVRIVSLRYLIDLQIYAS